MAVIKIHAKLSGVLNVKIKEPGKLCLSFLPKLVLVTKEGIRRKDNFYLFFTRWCLYDSEILTELISQNVATAPLNKDGQTYYQKPRS